MTANPWSKFFWNDWESDPALKLCSLAAQGLWMRMLCLAAKADPVGHVKIAGQSCTVADLSRLTGEREEMIAALLGELEQKQVFSRTRTGTIYNRRMNDDAKKSRTNAKNGREGGLVSHRNKKGIFQSLGEPTEQKDGRPPEPHKPRAISHKPASGNEGDGLKDAIEIVNAFYAIREHLWGSDPNNPMARGTEIMLAKQWLSDGAEFYPIRDFFERRMRGMHERGDEPPRSMIYFRDAVPQAMRQNWPGYAA